MRRIAAIIIAALTSLASAAAAPLQFEVSGTVGLSVTGPLTTGEDFTFTFDVEDRITPTTVSPGIAEFAFAAGEATAIFRAPGSGTELTFAPTLLFLRPNGFEMQTALANFDTNAIAAPGTSFDFTSIPAFVADAEAGPLQTGFGLLFSPDVTAFLDTNAFTTEVATSVPLPASAPLALLGLIALRLLRRR